MKLDKYLQLEDKLGKTFNLKSNKNYIQLNKKIKYNSAF